MVHNNTIKNNSILLEVLASVFTVSSFFFSGQPSYVYNVLITCRVTHNIYASSKQYVLSQYQYVFPIFGDGAKKLFLSALPLSSISYGYGFSDEDRSSNNSIYKSMHKVWRL